MIDKKSLKFQETLAAHQSTREKAYWLEKLSGIPDKVSFPSYLQKGASERRMHTVSRIFPQEVSSSLSRISSGKDHALHMVLTAAVVLLLHKYTCSGDIVVGMPIYKQSGAAVFVNKVVALRNKITANMTFKEILLQVKQIITEAVEHQNYPIKILSEQLNRPVDDEGNDGFPLFDVFILLESIHDKAYIEGISTNMVWCFTFNSIDNRLEAAVEYNALLYEEGALLRLIDHLIFLVQQVLANKDLPAAEVSLISSSERKLLLAALDKTAVRYPREKTIHQLFEEQAEKNGDSTAVVYLGRRAESGEQLQITYRELNQKSHQLAHLLREKSIGSHTIVGISVEPSIELIIGILGILRAGGAYLPIDPEYPQERIDYMLKDSNVRLLLAEPAVQVQVEVKVKEKKESVELIDISEVAFSSTSALTSTYPLDSASLAYIIYTSGSTGKPKGTAIQHRNVVRLFFNEAPLFDFSSRDTWTLFHSAGFDFSVWEMWGALLFGGKLVVLPRAVARDINGYLDILKKQQVTILNQTPSAFYVLMTAEIQKQERGLNLRYIIFGGEALTPGKLRPWREKYPQVKLVNMYGITETTVHVTYKEVTEREIESETSNIGVPIPTLGIYLLDKNLKPVPLGMAGELCVYGEGLCRGYLNRPELTAKKFVFSKKIYKTGDLGRVLENGDLEYLGRIDQQVKIRGFRIELGEIESQLLKHTDIKDAVVIDREMDSGEKYLCAYIIPVNSAGALGTAFNMEAMREFLSHSLPDYMIPVYFVTIDRIPLTPNNKVDRKKLPEPTMSRPQLETAYLEPSTRMEKLIADAWQEILRLDKIGINDNFFDLGGDSFRMVQVGNRLKTVLNKEVPVMMMFQYPTIRSLAQYLKEEETQDKTAAVEQKAHLEKKLDKGKARLKATRKKTK